MVVDSTKNRIFFICLIMLFFWINICIFSIGCCSRLSLCLGLTWKCLSGFVLMIHLISIFSFIRINLRNLLSSVACSVSLTALMSIRICLRLILCSCYVSLSLCCKESVLHILWRMFLLYQGLLFGWFGYLSSLTRRFGNKLLKNNPI